MKTKEELNALKEEVEALNKKLAELNGEELAQCSGGCFPPDMHPFNLPGKCPKCGAPGLHWHEPLPLPTPRKYYCTCFCEACEFTWDGDLSM